MENVEHQFRGAIEAAGLTPPEIVEADGRIHRFAPNGNPRDDAGWYVLYGDGVPAGAFGDWRSGETGTWRADIGKLSADEERAHAQRIEAMRQQREREEKQRHDEAAKRAAEIWNTAAPADASHAYLVLKGVQPHGLRLREGELVVPMRDGAQIHSLQFINADGEKRFLTGARVRGCYFSIGKPKQVLCVAEGFATGASVFEATGVAVAVAFSAGNLLPVAQMLRAKFPHLKIVVCADDDSHTAGNPGLTKAREAAQAIGGCVAVPDFGDDRPDDATDFNDLYRHAGAEAVCTCVARAVASKEEEEASGWAKPNPIVGSLRPVPTFDADVLLPDSLRAWVMDEAERMPCPPEFVAVAALVALGSIVGGRCAIKPKARDSWLIVPNLWGGIVGDPSAKKSPAWSAALKPLDRLIARALQRYQGAMAAYEVERVVFEARKDAIEDRIKRAARGKNKSDPAGDPAEIAKELIAQVAPDAPALRRYKTNDSTVEKLGELLRENPAGLLVLRDELVGLIANWEREGREGERAFFLEAWNGNQSFDTDRIGRGHIAIPNLCVSIFGGIQPDKLVVYLEQAANALANDGMLQRFQLLVYPDTTRWEWRDRVPNKEAGDKAHKVFDALADFSPESWGAVAANEVTKFPWFRFDDEAQAVFIRWSQDLHRERIPNEEQPLIRQHLAKFDKLYPALALMLHLVECAATGAAGEVTKDSALRAGAWCEFLEAHARRCYGLLMDDGLRAAQALATKLERGALEEGFTSRDIRRNQWRGLTTDEAIQAALDWLEDEGWLRSEASGGTGPGTGRRTVRYRMNPAIRRIQQGGAA